jgi:hypothetical protein
MRKSLCDITLYAFTLGQQIIGTGCRIINKKLANLRRAGKTEI